jgi:predicted phage terminase large subunit-like protein
MVVYVWEVFKGFGLVFTIVVRMVREKLESIAFQFFTIMDKIVSKNFPVFKVDDILAKKAKMHLLDFTTYTFPRYQVNWHHQIICEYLERWAWGDIKRLMIFSPPRSGKSEIVSRRLPAWVFGHRPDASIIAASYGMDLASKMNRDVQRVISCDEYKRVFPDVGLSGRAVRTVTAGESYLRNKENFEIVGHKGIYKCSGIGGGITGMGFTHGIIDDPTKDRKDAESKAVQDTIWDWYTSTFYTRRMDDDARILLTLTRWGSKDLAGKLLQLAKDDEKADQWVVLSFPMIAEEPLHERDPRQVGDPLWPERFSMESLIATRSVMGPYDWAALMQQNPIASAGNVFERGWFQFYSEEPKILVQDMEEVVMVWDLAIKEKKDFNVGEIWGRRGVNKYLLGQYRGQGDFPATLKEFRELCIKWPEARKKLVEDKANGPAIMSSLKHEIPGIVELPPGGKSKEIRAMAAAPDAEAGNVFVPNPGKFHWVDDFLTEVCDFPNGKNDDQLDCFVYAILYFNKRISIRLPTMPMKPVVIGSGVDKMFSRPQPSGRRRSDFPKI